MRLSSTLPLSVAPGPSSLPDPFSQPVLWVAVTSPTEAVYCLHSVAHTEEALQHFLLVCSPVCAAGTLPVA